MSLKTDPSAAAQPVDLALRRQAEAVGEALQLSVADMLDRLAAAGRRDQKALQATLQLSQSVVSRLMSSVRQGDPLATLASIPGQEALRQMLRGASRAGAGPDCVARVQQAIENYEAFVDTQVGDRSTLDAVLSDWVHESRASFELRHKAAAFKAMSALRGVQADLVFTTGILHPGAEPGRLDCLGLDGVLGCRRTRPSGVLHLFGYTLMPERDDGQRHAITGLAGQPLRSMADVLMPGFSSVPPEAVRTERLGDVVQTTVGGLPLGRVPLPGADLVCAQHLHGVHRAWRGPGSSATTGIGGQAEPPTACFIVDVLLHEDVWPGVQPELQVLDTVVRGVAHPDDASRQADRIDTLESVQFLGRGADTFRMPEYPRYTELVRQACQAVGWDAGRLRGYRCRVRYPIYGAQIGLGFRLPDAP